MTETLKKETKIKKENLKDWDSKNYAEIKEEARKLTEEERAELLKIKDKHFCLYVIWREFYARNIMVSKNYTLADLTGSQTAKEKRIDNRPNEEQIENLNYLAKGLLDSIHRNHTIERINCAFRCTELNKAVGGEERSQHLEGQAADIVIANLTKDKFQAMRDFEVVDQMYWDTKKGFVHASFDKLGNRNRKWIK